MKSLVFEVQTRAESVKVENNWVVVSLEDGREIRFPVSMNKRLRKASEEAVRNVELICGGTGLHWPEIDEDLSVCGIIEGRLGN